MRRLCVGSCISINSDLVVETPTIGRDRISTPNKQSWTVACSTCIIDENVYSSKQSFCLFSSLPSGRGVTQVNWQDPKYKSKYN